MIFFNHFLTKILRNKKFAILFLPLILYLLLFLFEIGFFKNIINIIPIFTFLFDELRILIGISIIIFLPLLPLFFIIYKVNTLNFLEKLTYTIIFNYTFYVLIGYIGYLLGVPLNSWYFFIISIIFFGLLFSVIFISKKLRIELLKPQYNIFSNFSENIKKLKNKLGFNGFLLIIFLFLMCIFNVIRFSYFFGTDAWLHITIIKKISISQKLPLEDYHATLSLHIFCTVIYLFSGVDFLLIPKYFVFYTIFLSALVFYNLALRILKNKDLVILGTFLLEVSSLGFRYTMYQFWPSAMSLILSLFLFFQLYTRLLNFIKEIRPTKKEIFTRLINDYILMSLVFITAMLTHVLTILVFILGFFWIFLIYFIKDYRRGFDFFIICCFLVIFIILSIFGLGEGHYFYLEDISLSWYFYIIGIIGFLAVFIPITYRFKISLLFTTGRYSATIKGEKSLIFKKIDEKFMIPITIISSIFFLIIFSILNLIFFHLDFSTIFDGLEIILFTVLATWGLILFQKKPRGKPLFIWYLSYIGILSIALMLYIIFESRTPILARVYILASPLIIIGFLTYLYKLIKVHSIRKKKAKILIFLIILLSIFSSFYYESRVANKFSLMHRDTALIRWYAEKSDEKSNIIAEFGWNFVFIYYDYPYNDKSNPGIYEIHNFIYYKNNLINPNNHFEENGINKLKEMKNQTGKDVYILYDDYYILKSGYETYEQLDEKDHQKYYDAKYINKIGSSKTENGVSRELFWVV